MNDRKAIAVLEQQIRDDYIKWQLMQFHQCLDFIAGCYDLAAVQFKKAAQGRKELWLAAWSGALSRRYAFGIRSIPVTEEPSIYTPGTLRAMLRR